MKEVPVRSWRPSQPLAVTIAICTAAMALSLGWISAAPMLRLLG